MKTKSQSQVLVYKQEIKKRKGTPLLVWSLVKTDGDEKSALKAVKKLQASGVIAIKIDDQSKGVNILYNKLINSKNYTSSVVKRD